MRRRLGRSYRSLRSHRDLLADRLRGGVRPPHIALFHEFSPPPGGGGHQFLRALCSEFSRRGWRVGNNYAGRRTNAILYNSFNFDAQRLRVFASTSIRCVHRVDGPVQTYRGLDDGTDAEVAALNREFADSTILQSHYSQRAHQHLGIQLTSPAVIQNAPDHTIFRPGERHGAHGSKTRVVATSWSDNPNKGVAVYEWVDRNLDAERYEFTFVGRLPARLERARMLGPLTTVQLAAELRRHDVFLTASRNDPCSNSLLEALASGLPAVYLDSGGHAEIVGRAGLAFGEAREIPGLLAEIVARYDEFRGAISVPRIADVADQYLAMLGLPTRPDHV